MYRIYEKKILVVITARFASTRLTGKVLLEIVDKPLLRYVVDNVKKVQGVEYLVATESEAVSKYCETEKIPYLMTSDKHETPTSRIHEVSKYISADIYVFIGADEPFITSETIQSFVHSCSRIKDDFLVSNCFCSLIDHSEIEDINRIKVVLGANNRIIYTSRNVVPGNLGSSALEYKKFCGLAAFSRTALSFYQKTPISYLEAAEKCDLLRFIEHGMTVNSFEISATSWSIDTISDLEKMKIKVGQGNK